MFGYGVEKVDDTPKWARFDLYNMKSVTIFPQLALA